MPDLQHLFARVFRFALNMTRNRESAEDIAQETLLRAIRDELFHDGLNLDPQKEKELAAWLFRVARNLWLDEIKSPKFQKRMDTSLEQNESDQSTQRIELHDEINQALELMKTLPDTQRQALYLHAVESLTVDEIAEALGTSRSSIKTSLSLARRKMRQQDSQLRSAEAKP